MTADFGFAKIKSKPVLLKNEMLQTVRLEVKISDAGVEIIIRGRHEKIGELVSPGQQVKIEEEDEG